VTKLLQCLRDGLVRRDDAATTIRSDAQIVDAFRQHTRARLDRITPAPLRRYHLSSSRSVVWRSGPWSRDETSEYRAVQASHLLRAASRRDVR
jgi:hypothetical protein